MSVRRHRRFWPNGCAAFLFALDVVNHAGAAFNFWVTEKPPHWLIALVGFWLAWHFFDNWRGGQHDRPL